MFVDFGTPWHGELAQDNSFLAELGLGTRVEASIHLCDRCRWIWPAWLRKPIDHCLKSLDLVKVSYFIRWLEAALTFFYLLQQHLENHECPSTEHDSDADITPIAINDEEKW
jgi:hypothetical protein